MHSDQKYIDALRENNNKVVAEIYERFAPKMLSFLKSRNASEEEAGDVFQEALIDIYKLAADGKFQLNCPFEAFLLLICKRKWINLARKNQRTGVTKSIDDGYFTIADETDAIAAAHAQQLEKELMVMEMLKLLSARCREIILASYSAPSQEKLANDLGVSYGYLRKKKSVCMSELLELVAKNKNL